MTESLETPAPADPRNSPVRRAAEQLELLSPDAREMVLAKMNPEIAEQIRMQLASMPDRPLGQFSSDVASRREMLHATAQRVSARKIQAADRAVAQTDPAMAQTAPLASTPLMGGATQSFTQPAAPVAMAAPSDPLEQLRTLHPAAIARAMQGERAEAWAIVLDRLDANAHAALQLYLDSTARMAIEDARARQAELAATSPALIGTIEAAIARTVVPRAMREHHQLLSTTPLTWTGITA